MANVAFDVDGVLFDIEKFQIEEGQKFFKRNAENIYGYGIKEVFNCTKKEEVSFWIKNTIRYNLFTKARRDAAETTQALKNRNNKVYIFTARAKTTENNLVGFVMRMFLKISLIINRIHYDKVVFCSTENSGQEKAELCSKYNIKAIVEDSKDNINFLRKVDGLTVVGFRTKNNEDDIHNSDLYAQSFNKIFKILFSDYSGPVDVRDFRKLDFNQIEKLSNCEKISYFKKIKEFYLEQDIDISKLNKDENGCKKILRIIQPIYNALYKPITRNPEKFPKAHGVIFAANHLHAYDPLLIMSNAKGVPFRLLVKSEIKENKFLGWLFKTVGSKFVDHDKPESRVQALDEMIKELLCGGNVMMFPEGTRKKDDNPNSELLKFYYGTVTVAQITGAPIYPFAINKDYRFGSNNLKKTIGDPIFIGPTDDLTKANNKLRETIRRLVIENESKIDRLYDNIVNTQNHVVAEK